MLAAKRHNYRSGSDTAVKPLNQTLLAAHIDVLKISQPVFIQITVDRSRFRFITGKEIIIRFWCRHIDFGFLFYAIGIKKLAA
ncbi:hypothetical protein SDC9_87069 [bioreactor metagenome]|uniref:Uncharacterized protein n=1 Tax=bioreactor metagenome TaxID=1076179 RepID=A0A644ZJB6_9ZZZZ